MRDDSLAELATFDAESATHTHSHDDLVFAEGKEEELLGRLQQRLGKSKEDVRAEIERL